MSAIKDKQRVQKTPFHECKTEDEHRAELIRHLQTAMVLEHATIPPYLCALYSIKDGTNLPAAQRIRSVAVEEMLHMVLVANIMNAIGGTPALANENFIPRYPSFLPESDETVEVSLNRFSPDAIQVFLDIERPKDPDAEPKHDDYASIGQFYAAIKDELDFFCREVEAGRFSELFIGDPGLQISPADYYSGGGEVVQVDSYETARRAIKVIVDEGEGFGHSIFSGDHEQFGEQIDLAHFYKFNEIAVGRTYLPNDSPARDPTGARLIVDYDAAYPAVFPDVDKDEPPETLEEKTLRKYPEKVRGALREFNRTYSRLLRAIEAAFTGTSPATKSQHFQDAVGLMYEVKYQMIRLMKIPMDAAGETTVGPTFIYVNE